VVNRRIAWLVPYPLRGSGGHRTIYQNIHALAQAGYVNDVYLEPHPPPGHGPTLTSAQQGRAMAEEYFGEIPASFHLGFRVSGAYDAVFATAWFTAPFVRRIQQPCIKAYFIQDYEAAFMPMSDGYVQAQNTFRYGFEGVTIGRWLTHRLGTEFGMRCSYFDFCADPKVYRPLSEERELAVCFVYQPEKPRRCTLIGGQALTLVKREMPEVEIYFYGNDSPIEMPFQFTHLGLLPIEKCNELYNRCAVGLCFSATNPSRIPFEMMAAGLPVVDMWGSNTIYDLPEDGVELAEPTPESVAWAILDLLRDPARRAARSAAGQAFMAPRDLESGFRQFVRFVDGLFDPAQREGAAAVSPVYTRPPVQAPADVLPRFQATLEEIEAMKPPPPVVPVPLPPPRRRIKAQAQPRTLPGRVVHRLQHTLRVFLTGA
jgi:hypothetical protein